MKFEIKTKNSADRRKWDIREGNRLDVVKALGRAFSPREASEMKAGEWYAKCFDTQIKLIEA